MPPDPTDAELDELLSQRSHWNPAITRYAKALRACRREADVVRENLDSFRAPVTSRSDDTVKLSLAGRVFALGERDEACRARAGEEQKKFWLEQNQPKLISGRMNSPTIRSIQERTALVFGIPIEAMTAKGRTRPLARARQAAMYLSWKLTDNGPSAIARAFNRDH
ncbi:hypothetical protein LCGC14_1826580, partial [marine sediment metagenome]